MPKPILVKLTKSSSRVTGPFTIEDSVGSILADDVTKSNLISGKSVEVADDAVLVVIKSKDTCEIVKTLTIVNKPSNQVAASTYQEYNTGCIWRHLKNPTIYNSFYGETSPYIIEYPFSYQFQDEILQNVKDFTRVYEYFPDIDLVTDEHDRIEVDNKWFNKAVLYNGQQSTGLLELVPKPMNNLKDYMKYPVYNTNSKVITYTKSDNFYQYNTFWSLVKDKRLPLFVRTCESLSIDKVVNQANMDYGKRSFKKEPLRAKDLRVRHILDNRSDVHLVSQFIITPAQISYK
jgi:hypothetical protein